MSGAGNDDDDDDDGGGDAFMPPVNIAADRYQFTPAALMSYMHSTKWVSTLAISTPSHWHLWSRLVRVLTYECVHRRYGVHHSIHNTNTFTGSEREITILAM